MISSGEIGGKRVPLLKAIMRCEVGTKESEFRKKLLKETKKSLESDEVAVVDAGFTIREMLESDVDRFVLREAINCTARRNELPERKEKADHPNMVILCVRSRCYRGKRLEATTPDSFGQFVYSGRLIRYQAWHNRPQDNQGGYSQPHLFDLRLSGSCLSHTFGSGDRHGFTS
ncbi:hypothetical protein KFU94_25660 [Chloroflexi bacterium TSY]|nr:hypothetical protein [Chloroflexi bacterium TSY]